MKKIKIPFLDSAIKSEQSMADNMAWLRAVSLVVFFLLFGPFAIYLLIFDSIGVAYEKAFWYAVSAGGITTIIIIIFYNIYKNRK